MLRLPKRNGCETRERPSPRSSGRRSPQCGMKARQANESHRAEIASLESELAAAREVGKAAIDALRYEAVQPAPALSKPGWWASVLRRPGLLSGYPLSVRRMTAEGLRIGILTP